MESTRRLGFISGWGVLVLVSPLMELLKRKQPGDHQAPTVLSLELGSVFLLKAASYLCTILDSSYYFFGW